MTDSAADPGADRDSGAYPGVPRWVRVFGILIAIPILLFLILLLTHGPGGHGPGRHFRSDGDQPSPYSTTEEHAPRGGNPADHTPAEGGH